MTKVDGKLRFGSVPSEVITENVLRHPRYRLHAAETSPQGSELPFNLRRGLLSVVVVNVLRDEALAKQEVAAIDGERPETGHTDVGILALRQVPDALNPVAERVWDVVIRVEFQHANSPADLIIQRELLDTVCSRPAVAEGIEEDGDNEFVFIVGLPGQREGIHYEGAHHPLFPVFEIADGKGDGRENIEIIFNHSGLEVNEF